MSSQELQIVTGAFGYIGKYITMQVLGKGYRVRTLTNSVNRANPFGGKVEAHPFHFEQPDQLVELLRGATVLYNTYWVDFCSPIRTLKSESPSSQTRTNVI